jgi:hypothetical protein
MKNQFSLSEMEMSAHIQAVGLREVSADRHSRYDPNQRP